MNARYINYKLFYMEKKWLLTEQKGRNYWQFLLSLMVNFSPWARKLIISQSAVHTSVKTRSFQYVLQAIGSHLNLACSYTTLVLSPPIRNNLINKLIDHVISQVLLKNFSVMKIWATFRTIFYLSSEIINNKLSIRVDQINILF